jgi:hypothetical protein
VPLKKCRNEKSLKEDFKHLKPILQMRTRPRKTEKFKIVRMPSKHAPSAYWAMSKSGKLLLSMYDLD